MLYTSFLVMAGYLATTLASSATTAPAIPSCQLTGTIKGIGRQPILFQYRYHGQEHTDTVRATHDQFRYTAHPSDDGTIDLIIDRSQWTSFWYEPGKVQVSGSISAPYQLTFTGTPSNEVLTKYRRQIEWPYYANVRKAMAAKESTLPLRQQRVRESLQFVEQHLSSQASTDILLWQTHYDDTQAEAYGRLLARMPKARQTSVQGRAIAQRLTILRNMPVVGKVAADFTMPDTAGVATSLASFRGRYVVLDFWGHWCGPCIRVIPQLSALHQQYGPQVAFVGIAAESAQDKQLWLQAIRKHHAGWTQLSELAGDESPVLTTYNISAFPTYLLLNPQGVVVERTSDVEQLEKALASLPKP
ncbi:TlpA disulfide reductase family protein [Hymenobacter rigui]|uniref:AhpC/TSA family protein n=1 Tax=Hymenobacter rigui TaxID=334424 RepID=A0A3R9NX08_9BACT|nr:TlpA disulfide reductase family protein [Hymenobacter rigui]RSK43715.1 AhpC/TSA family protein [Hymenobacter rigui]